MKEIYQKMDRGTLETEHSAALLIYMDGLFWLWNTDAFVLFPPKIRLCIAS